MVGIAALKSPLTSYKQQVFEKSGVAQQSDYYALEIGWAFTLEEYSSRDLWGTRSEDSADTRVQAGSFRNDPDSQLRNV